MKKRIEHLRSQVTFDLSEQLLKSTDNFEV